MKLVATLLALLLTSTFTFAQLEAVDLTGKIKKAYYLDSDDQLVKKSEARYIVTFTETPFPTMVSFEKKTLAGYIRLSGHYIIGSPNKRHGKFLTYYEGEKIHKEERYEHDKLSGAAKYFTVDGKVSSEGTYADGKKNGQWTEYMIDGSHFKGKYLNGNKEGPWQKFKNNSLIYTEKYRFGRAIGTTKVNTAEVAIVCLKKNAGTSNDLWYGCINMQGEEIVPLAYDYIEKVSRNMQLKVTKDGKQGLLSYTGAVQVPIVYDRITRFYSKGYRVSKDGKMGLITGQNEVLIPIEYESLKVEVGPDLLRAKKNGKWGFISSKNEIIANLKYDEVCEFINGRAFARIGTKWLTIDQKGNEYPDKPEDGECPSFATLESISDYDDNFNRSLYTAGRQKFKLTVFKGHEGKGVLDSYDNFIVEEKFKDIKWYVNGRICVQNMEGKWGFYNDLGEEVVPCKYDKVYPFGALH